MATLIHVVIAVYVDDVFIVETAETTDSAVEILKIVREALCFQLERTKKQHTSREISLLGAEISIDAGGIAGIFLT